MRPACRRVTPTSVFISVVLPVPLRPSSAERLALRQHQVDALHDDRFAVAGPQPGDAQQLSHGRPRRGTHGSRTPEAARRARRQDRIVYASITAAAITLFAALAILLFRLAGR